MRPLSNLFSSCTTTACLVLAFLALQASAAYFRIDEPILGREWTNNAVHLITWNKGVLDGIDGFDVEMARMSQDGLHLIARNIPAKQRKLNIMLQDLPAGDDYFLIFINSTHGVMHSTSSRFTILAPNAATTQSPLSPDASVPTVTVSGSPHPTKQFATTFPAIISTSMGALAVQAPHLAALAGTVVGCAFGAVWTLGLW